MSALPPAAVGEHEAATLLSVSVDTVRRARKRGELPHFRLGRRVLYSRAELDKFMASCPASTSSESPPPPNGTSSGSTKRPDVQSAVLRARAAVTKLRRSSAHSS